MDLGKLKDVLSTVTSVAELKEPQDELVDDIGLVINELQNIFGDGLQWSDAGRVLGTIVPDFMEIAGGFKDKTGPEKRELVVDLVWATYKYFDPNIPFIPEPFETKLERLVVTKVAEAAVEAVWRVWTKVTDLGEENVKEEVKPFEGDPTTV